MATLFESQEAADIAKELEQQQIANTKQSFEKALEASKYPGTLQFPPNRNRGIGGDNPHTITFRAFKYARSARKANNQKHLQFSIVLPLPANVGTGYGINWNSTELGLIGNAVSNAIGDNYAGAIRNIAKGGNYAGAISSIIDTTASYAKETKLSEIAKDASSLLLGKALEVAGKNIVGGIDALSTGTGMAVNPHMAMLFKGVNQRQHQFRYQFFAQNIEESQLLTGIINKLRWAALPGFMGGVAKDDLLDYPFQWDIQFSDNIRPHLFDIKPSVMTSLNVDYSGHGGVQSFFKETGAPVGVTFEMSFTEIEILTKEDVEDSPNIGLVQ